MTYCVSRPPPSKALFKIWEPVRRPTFGHQGSIGVAKSPREASAVDVDSMLQTVSKNETPVDDGSGKLKIW